MLAHASEVRDDILKISTCAKGLVCSLLEFRESYHNLLINATKVHMLHEDK